MFDLQWCLPDATPYVLTDLEQEKRQELLTASIRWIDDDVILKARYLSMRVKVVALDKKYGISTTTRLKLKQGHFYYKSFDVYNITHGTNVLKLLSSNNSADMTTIYFQDYCWLDRNYFSYCISANKKKYYPTYEIDSDSTFRTAYGLSQLGRKVKFILPRNVWEKECISIYYMFKKQTIELFRLHQHPDICSGTVELRIVIIICSVILTLLLMCFVPLVKKKSFYKKE